MARREGPVSPPRLPGGGAVIAAAARNSRAAAARVSARWRKERGT